MFTLVRRYAESITQPCWLKVKVTVQGHGFEPWILCPLCISFTPGRIFSQLWSNVRLSGTMCRTHNSAMGTEGQGHGLRSRVWALNFMSSRYYPWKAFLLILIPDIRFYRFFLHSGPWAWWAKLAYQVMLTIRGRLITPFVLGSMSVGLNILIRHSFMDLWFWITALVPWPQLLWSNVCLSEIMCRTHSLTMQTHKVSSRSQVWALNLVSALYLLYPWEDFL